MAEPTPQTRSGGNNPIPVPPIAPRQVTIVDLSNVDVAISIPDDGKDYYLMLPPGDEPNSIMYPGVWAVRLQDRQQPNPNGPNRD